MGRQRDYGFPPAFAPYAEVSLSFCYFETDISLHGTGWEEGVHMDFAPWTHVVARYPEYYSNSQLPHSERFKPLFKSLASLMQPHNIFLLLQTEWAGHAALLLGD